MRLWIRCLISLSFATACGDDSASGIAGGGSGGLDASVGGTGGAGAAGGSTSGGAAGSTGGAGGSGGRATGGNAGGDASGSSCKSGTETFHFVVSPAEQYRRIPLALDVGVEYRHVELTFGYTPTAWSPTCYNPAAGGSTKSGFCVRVTVACCVHWCKGGICSTHPARIPPGSCASKRLRPTTQRGTTGQRLRDDGRRLLFSSSHGISAGVKHTAKLVFDATWER
jgi:hypothetical protein